MSPSIFACHRLGFGFFDGVFRGVLPGEMTGPRSFNSRHR
jgi:hypothetical protein